MRWIIDTDAGIDDALALAMPFGVTRYPDFHLQAITTLTGNVHVEHVLVNVGAVLDLLDVDVPFYRGCDRPMVTPHSHAEDFHGADGLGDAGLSHTCRRPMPGHAALAIVEMARRYPGELSICALGPLTNIALACNVDPELPARVARLIVMGGAWQACGNQTAAAEFNIHADPESARTVLERFSEITMLPWETSLNDLWPFERIEAIVRRDTPRARFMGAMVAKLCDAQRDPFGIPGFPVPDPLAMAVALDDSVIRQDVAALVSVDTGHGVGRGLSALDRRHSWPNTRVVTAVHRERALAMIESAWQ
jgi:purine nucleosidase